MDKTHEAITDIAIEHTKANAVAKTFAQAVSDFFSCKFVLDLLTDEDIEALKRVEKLADEVEAKTAWVAVRAKVRQYVAAKTAREF